MVSPVLRWVAVPICFATGVFGASWVFLKIRLDCVHIGTRPENLCSDWWYANHGWIAVVAARICVFSLSMLAPVVWAPTHKRIVAYSALGLTVCSIIAAFTPPTQWWLVRVCAIAATIRARGDVLS